MATWNPFIEDLTENFFMCSVCLDQFNEPKLLPCLHRYCNDCLRKVVQASHDGTIECPLCKQRCCIPKDGLDGFKTDFHMKSVLEFIELRKSFEKKDFKQCVSCSKDVVCSAYCFKCRDFLCDECYKVHISNKMFTDHQPSTLKLENMAAKNLTMEEIAAMTEDPRCHFHIKEPAKLCCGTCQNEPVCLVCTHGKHKGHDLIDVNDLAQKERTLLNRNLAELSKHKTKLYALPEKVQMTLVKLNENVTKKTKLLTIQYEEQAKKIKEKLAECYDEREKGAADIENRRGCEKREMTVKHEEEMNRLITKHQENMKSTDVKYDQELEEFKDNCKETEGEFFKKLGELDSNFKTLTTAKDLLTSQNKNECEEILNKCKQLIKRFENLSATSSSILACNDDWTDAQCVPDIRSCSQ
ncbi:E3 ubiquitin-protein ligase TRIM56-like [Apostichopus japonicus]|uniref:E3 ubiquitin-protein ligase TRIM56-like n=1 Tax=Stichopus japonicus TaxID=307972 RepID=UPI003AB4AF56